MSEGITKIRAHEAIVECRPNLGNDLHQGFYLAYFITNNLVGGVKGVCTCMQFPSILGGGPMLLACVGC